MSTKLILVAGERVKVHTAHVYPPIPSRTTDWSAVDDNYEPGCPVGWGPTEQAAIDNLVEQLEEAAA